MEDMAIYQLPDGRLAQLSSRSEVFGTFRVLGKQFELATRSMTEVGQPLFSCMDDLCEAVVKLKTSKLSRDDWRDFVADIAGEIEHEEAVKFPDRRRIVIDLWKKSPWVSPEAVERGLRFVNPPSDKLIRAFTPRHKRSDWQAVQVATLQAAAYLEARKLVCVC